MEPEVKVFSGFRDSDRADREYYRRLSPQQRLDILLELITRHRGPDEAAKGFERVYRIVPLHES